MNLSPPFLVDGDTVHLVSSARAISQELIKLATDELALHGLRALATTNLTAEDYQMAGSDVVRAAAVQEAIDSHESKAVLFMRGGYGTQRIIDRLDFSQFVKRPKWLIGFSDVTCLHSHLNNHLGVQSIHHAMASTFKATSRAALDGGYEMLKGGTKATTFTSVDVNVPGEASGRLVGGNLSVIHTMIGTPSAFKAEGSILFIEDLDEMLYHLDRMLLHMRRANQFDGLKGVLIGGFSEMRDNTKAHGFSSDNPFGKDAYGILKEHLVGLGVPIADRAELRYL